MAAKKLRAPHVGLPAFKVPKHKRSDPRASPFELSSHARAREALDFGLRTREPGFNIFVLGQRRSGRMTATRSYLEAFAAGIASPPSDWLYLNNFRRPHKPKPYRLPAGHGRRFRDRMAGLVDQLFDAIANVLSDPSSSQALREEGTRRGAELQEKTERLVTQARLRGIDLKMTPRGPVAAPLGIAGEARDLGALDMREQREFNAAMAEINESLMEIQREAVETQAEMRTQAAAAKRRVVENAIAPLLDALSEEFGALAGIARWLVELRQDILDNVELFEAAPSADRPPAASAGPMSTPQLKSAAHQRYAVNLLVDNVDDRHPPVIVEPSPTFENLFGAMEYRIENGVLTTDFSMIRAGAIHRANGGILMLRAEGLAASPLSWAFLKAALRDGEIRIEEPQRFGSLPLTGAPKPKPIPLDIKIVLVGAPLWYYAFLGDPEFANYFKIKADIDATMDANARNLDVFSRLIRQASITRAGVACDDSAVAALLGQSSRWAGDRNQLAACFELVEDVLAEAGARLADKRTEVITGADVNAAIRERRQRNSRVEDHAQELIDEGAILIDTEGSAVGQVNGLTVREMGDHVFGGPARVTARTYAGTHGVINIDRLTGHGGPIQQKGMFILGGYLHGLFSHPFPISFSATVTFEQLYGGVEGDSASLAELCAIVSSLADLPVRQDIAITGSINQVGEAQVIGGLRHKVEGFYRVCAASGLTGTQGVILPRANEDDLVLRDEVAEAVAGGQFHLWSVAHVDEALALFTGVRAGRRGKSGRFGAGSIYARVQEKLEHYDQVLRRRGEGG